MKVERGSHMKVFVARSVRAAFVATLGLAAVAGTAEAAPTGLNAYTVPDANPQALRALAQQGFDLTEGRSGGATEIVATAEQARALSKFGISTTPQARGTATAQAQVLAERLGLPLEQVQVLYGDTLFPGTVLAVDGGYTAI